MPGGGRSTAPALRIGIARERQGDATGKTGVVGHEEASSETIVQAWLDAAADPGIEVEAPFTLRVGEQELSCIALCGTSDTRKAGWSSGEVCRSGRKRSTYWSQRWSLGTDSPSSVTLTLGTTALYSWTP